MKTVKEISVITGISVRTLHYYDEIGLLKPTAHKENGYRLYDDKALEQLQQILFFREFGMPLKEIKSVMESPNLDRGTILKSQKNMLILKRDRLSHMIDSIDAILRGENKMDFTVFNETEVEALYQSLIQNMDEEGLHIILEQYKDLDHFHTAFINGGGTETAQANFQKVVEWYGGKENAMKAANNNSSEIMESYQKRCASILQKIADQREKDVRDMDVKVLVGEYDFVAKQLYQMEDVTALMREMAIVYMTDDNMITANDAQYGEGASVFIGKAFEEFYRET